MFAQAEFNADVTSSRTVVDDAALGRRVQTGPIDRLASESRPVKEPSDCAGFVIQQRLFRYKAAMFHTSFVSCLK